MNDYLSKVAGRASQNSLALRPLSPILFGPSIVTLPHCAISEEIGEPMSGMRESKALSGEEQPKVVPTTNTVQQVSKPQAAARPNLLLEAEPRTPVETRVTKIEPAIHRGQITPLIPAGTKLSASVAPDQPARHHAISMLQPGERRLPQNQMDASLTLEEKDKVLPARQVASPIGETASTTAIPVTQSAVAPSKPQASFDWKERKSGDFERHPTWMHFGKGAVLQPSSTPTLRGVGIEHEHETPKAKRRTPNEGSLTRTTESSGLLPSQTYGHVGVQSTSPLRAAPEINVTIGRIEIRAVSAPLPKEPPLSKPRLSLDDYLRSRNRGAT
jgi:hypothetical protein